MYRDRNGNPIDVQQFSELANRQAYKFLRDDLIGEFRLVTIWDGFDVHRSWDEDSPVIFSTGVFFAGALVCEARAETEAAALEQHASWEVLLRTGASLRR